MRYFLLLLCLAVTSAQAGLGWIEGRVVAVADGDTLTVLDASLRQHRVRLAEIDAPEKGQPFGQAAKRALGELCFERTARVLVLDKDRYDRIFGRVYCAGADANMAQVERGYAWVYDRYAKDPALRQAQARARAARYGLWSDPSPTPPWEWRRR